MGGVLYLKNRQNRRKRGGDAWSLFERGGQNRSEIRELPFNRLMVWKRRKKPGL
jgi:hypothetical protein